MKVNGKALERAIERVAVTRFSAELREAVVYGAPVLGEVLRAYEDELTKSKRLARKVFDWCAGAVLVSLVFYGWWRFVQ
jgi:hypothetical protein